MIKQANIDDDEQNSKVKDVWYFYLTSSLVIAALATFASTLAYYLNIYYPLTSLQIRILQIFGVAVVAAPFWNRYSVPVREGASAAQKLNRRLLIACYSIGFFIIVFSFQLHT